MSATKPARIYLCLLAAISFLITAQIAAAQNPPDSPSALCLWYAAPANPRVWEEALPVGSGRLGAMVFGGVIDERVQFNEDTLWTGKPHDYDRAGAGDALPEIRQLVFAGKPDDAAKIVRARFLSDPVRQKAYQPFGDLRFHFPDPGPVSDYRRQLDLSTAIATVDYRAGGVYFHREVFASYPDKVIVIYLAADRPGRCSFTLKMDSPHKGSRTMAAGSRSLVLTGQVHDLVAPYEAGLRFQSVVRASSTGGTISTAGDTLSVQNADNVMLVLAAATSFKNFQDITADPAALCEVILDNVNGKSYEALRSTHIADHQSLFGRVAIDLGHSSRDTLPTDQRLKLVSQAIGAAAKPKSNEPAPTALPDTGLTADPGLAALMFQYGRYLLISCSRPGTQPANLQGIWNELLNPPWESKYTTNINVEMNYWPAEVTNLSECHLPLFDMIHDLTISGGRTAEALYHSRGWVLHHNTDLWRGTAPINNIDGVWPTGGAWLCTHLWEHYLFTGDKTFLAKVYPDLKGASLFFIDSLVKDPHTGYLVTNPSFSPEQGTLCAGPAMDMQLIRALFDATTNAANLLNIDSDFVQQIAATRPQLAPDRIGKYGQLQEWQQDIDQPNNNHRHMSPLWGLYPGAEFTPADPKIFDAAKVLLKWRGDGSTGWSYAWRIPLWARVHDGDMAFRQLYLQLAKRMCPNMFDKCGPYQIDGNFSATAGIAEMLLQSQLTSQADPVVREIDLLPALPHAWPDGSVTNLCARDGFDVSMNWQHGALRQVTIRSKLGRPCLLTYGNAQKQLNTKVGESYSFDGQLNPIPSSAAAN